MRALPKSEKFERTARRDAAVAQEHHARVQYVAGQHRAICPCLWRGEQRSTRAEAQADADMHRNVAAP